MADIHTEAVRLFVRSKYQITHDNPQATGARSTEAECIAEFGQNKWREMLREMNDSGVALLLTAFQSWYKRFQQTGDICPILLGTTREEIIAEFGKPTDTGGTSHNQKGPLILKWNDDLEFHFAPDTDKLVLIYKDIGGIVMACIYQGV